MDKIEIVKSIPSSAIGAYNNFVINNKTSLEDFLSKYRREDWKEMKLASKWKVAVSGAYCVYAFYTPPESKNQGYYHSYSTKINNFKDPAWDEPYHKIIREFIRDGSSIYVFPEERQYRTIVLTLDD